MFIAILTLLSALSVSGVAIFYSVIGLATIFPGAFVPVVIMGSVLEVGKLVTASWLYRHWKQCRFLLKTYLTTAVVVLSLITSMGIFGFLSKAHLEQNLLNQSLTQRIEIMNNKMTSQEVYIKRQHAIIDRSEKAITRTGTSNTDDINIEKDNIANATDKLKTLLAVETSTITDLNNRLSILDNDVRAYTDKGKGFFGGGNIKRGIKLREEQKPERDAINLKIKEAQDRIDQLKEEYKEEIADSQARIQVLRTGSSSDRVELNITIVDAETNIINAQNNIDDLIIEREPLEASMIKLEAEVGPIKYIAALVVDWGITEDVDLNEAVRWVILIIICVFDPLAVALLVAANQSFLRRFPIDPLPPPPEISDLEKPEPYEPPVQSRPSSTELASKEIAQGIQKDWDQKLNAFNKKVPKPDDKPVEFIKDDETIPHVNLKSQKKTKNEEIATYKEKVAKEEEFEHRIQEEAENLERIAKEAKEEEPSVSELLAEGFAKEQKAREEEEEEEERIAKKEAEEKKIAGFEHKMKEEAENLEHIAKEAREEKVEEGIPNYIEPPISEQIEEVMEPERTRPDFTELIKPEVAVKEMMTVPTNVIKDLVKVQSGLGMKRGAFGTVIVEKGKVTKQIKPKITAVEQTALPTMTTDELQKEFDIKPNYVQNEEQDDTTIWNKIKYTNYKNRLASDDEYRQRIEKRIDDLMGQLERKEIGIEELTKDDQKIILDILNQNA